MNIINEMSKVKDDFSGCTYYWVAYECYRRKSESKRKIRIHSASPGIDVIIEDKNSEIATIRLNRGDNDNVMLEDSSNRRANGKYKVSDAVNYILSK